MPELSFLLWRPDNDLDFVYLQLGLTLKSSKIYTDSQKELIPSLSMSEVDVILSLFI